VVIDKPPGLLTAPAPGASTQEPSALELLRRELGGPERGGGRLWLVHRLDRDASGLLVFARSARAFAWLKDDLRTRRMERSYVVVVRGELGAAGGAPARGAVQSFMRDAGRRVESVPVEAFRGEAPGPEAASRAPDARYASTRYQRIAAGRGCSLVEVALDTGRKHQIRVHLRELGHPILGDGRYGRHDGERLYLHAARLAFQHPASGRWLEFHSAAPREFWERVGAAPPARDALPASPASAGRFDSSWEDVADWYDALLDERRHDHYRELILPGAVRLLDVAPGSRVLDVACGQGALARRLALLGVEVVGVDLAPRLIELAQRRAARLARPPRFVVGDARDLAALELGTFDAAACVMALANLDPIDDVIGGCAALLRPGGALVAVLPHPAFRAPRQTSWGWERDARGAPRQYRRIDGYLSPAQVRIVSNPGEVARGKPAVETWTFHRPLQSYVRSLGAHGLWIDRLEEWPSQRSSQPGPRAAEENRARREIPLFLGLRARKVVGSDAHRAV
jgi:23S rRNA-/tRNA-specific pseudouridylate synthase/SAM-dependent methyltransferase